MFLLGKAGLPHDMALTVAVWPYENVRAAAWGPCLDQGTGYRRCWFYFYGFTFLLALGRNIPPSVSKTCAYHSQVITMSTEVGKFVWQVMGNQARSLDKSAIEGMLREVAAVRAKP